MIIRGKSTRTKVVRMIFAIRWYLMCMWAYAVTFLGANIIIDRTLSGDNHMVAMLVWWILMIMVGLIMITFHMYVSKKKG